MRFFSLASVTGANQTRSRSVPAGFQFGGHQPVLGIGRIILPECPASRVLSRLQIATERIPNLIPLTHRLPGGRLCGGNGAGSDDLQERVFNGIIDPQSAKSDAAQFAVV
jgi:hypothetical protein